MDEVVIMSNRHFVKIDLVEDSAMFEIMPGDADTKATLVERIAGDYNHDQIYHMINGYLHGVKDTCGWTVFTIDESSLAEVFDESESLSCMDDMEDLSVYEIDSDLMMDIFMEHVSLFTQTDDTD